VAKRLNIEKISCKPNWSYNWEFRIPRRPRKSFRVVKRKPYGIKQMRVCMFVEALEIFINICDGWLWAVIYPHCAWESNVRNHTVRKKTSSQIVNFKLSLNHLLVTMERIFAKSALRNFWEIYPDSEQYLKTWFDTAMSSKWKFQNEVKQSYVDASVLMDSRIVFNI